MKPYKAGEARIIVQSEGKETDFSALLSSATVTEEFGRISSAELVFDDGGFDDEDFPVSNSDQMLIGKQIEIRLGYDDDSECIFKGIVIRQRMKLSRESKELHVSVRHEAVKMSRVRMTRNFKDMTDSDLIKSIVSEYGITAEVDDTDAQHEIMCQYGATDWDFVNLRAEANGQLLYCSPSGIVSHAPDVHADPVLEIDNGFNLISLDAEIDGTVSFDSYTARTWNYVSREEESEEIQTGEFDTELGDQTSQVLSSALGNSKQNIDFDRMQPDTDSMAAWNKSALMLGGLSRISGRVSFPGHHAVHPGDLVKLVNVGTRFDGNALVSAVVHDFTEGLWTTELTFGLDDTRFAEKYNNISPLPAAGALPSVCGLQVAIVEQLADDPLGEDRILVRLFGGDDLTVWARLATLNAGNERGMCFIPEVGDEVVVGFINDNPNLAVVLGSLHGSANISPVPLEDDNFKKGFYSKEKIKLEFDDEKKSVSIETPGGNKFMLSDDAKGITLEDQNGNKFVMNDSGISIESTKDLTIKASQNLSEEGNNVELKANASFKATGNSGAEVSTSGSAVLKGSIVQIN